MIWIDVAQDREQQRGIFDSIKFSEIFEQLKIGDFSRWTGLH
jgi:hypothetical protein